MKLLTACSFLCVHVENMNEKKSRIDISFAQKPKTSRRLHRSNTKFN